jgi:hypothetical protein
MIQTLINKMSKWKRLGEKADTNGNRIIAHIPRDYPEAYLHAIYVPLQETKWKEYAIDIPDQLADLYRECNGLSIFSNSLSIYGIRENYQRDLSSAQFQPFDLKQHDKEHRSVWHKLKKKESDDRTFFGSYEWDGSGVYVTKSSEKVFRCFRNESTPRNEWKNIEYFLSSEYARLEMLFTDDGYLKSEENPTTPTDSI